jgi:hypothetical protein
MLSDFAQCEELFHTASGTAFADIGIAGHRETWPIRSTRFRAFLKRIHYRATGEAASAAEIRSALDLLEARAQFDGPQRPVHVRIAEQAGHIYLDLADEHWRVVEIAADGWRVTGSAPVRFCRPAGMLPLPVPEPGGSIETLWSFLNLPSRNDFVLIIAWLLAALRSRGPYPLLAVSGEQGSAKTVLSKLLKALIDPNAAPVRALSREERELMIAANNGHLLAFDNLSGLPHWLSDALCRLATGGSFAVRRLYTDVEEVLFEAARPILLNGIEDVISRPDLGDRAIVLTLASIADADRRPEADLWRQFEIARPGILGALVDGVVHGLRANNRVDHEHPPRMADLALWAAACETAFWPTGTFARAYAANRRAAIENLMEADPLATCVRTILGERSSWTGSASDLLRLCAQQAHADASMSPPWARNPRALAGRLRRAQTFLRTLDIEIIFGREGRSGTRVIRLSALGQSRSTANGMNSDEGLKSCYRVNGKV